MKINGLEVTKEDFMKLEKDLNNARKLIEHADYILGVLETSISENLKEDLKND